jgi:hypothetical protein
VSCFQCDLDIPHVCYAGMPRARLGWTDEAVAHLEAAQRAGFMGGLQQDTQRVTTKKKRKSR